MVARLKLKYWLPPAVGLVFLVLLLRQANPREIASALTGANYLWLIPAVLVFYVELWVRAVRYHHIIKTLRPVSAVALFPILVIGNMANNLLPLRAGEVYRAYLLGERHQLSKMASLGTGVVERLFDGLTLLALLSIAIIALGANGAIHDITLIAVAVFAIALAGFIAVLASPDGAERLIQSLARVLPLRLRERAVTMAVSFIEGLRSLRHPLAIVWVVGTSLVCWGLETLVYAFVGQAFGLDVHWGYYMMAVCAGNLALTAPSTQGGVGPFEFAVTQALLLASVDEPVAAAYAFAAHFTVLLPATLLGLYYLWTMHLSLGRLGKQAHDAMEPVAAEPEPVSSTRR